jgi:hypothetical protein
MIAAIDRLVSLADTGNAAVLLPAIAAVTEIKNNMTDYLPIVAPNQPDGAPFPDLEPIADVPPDAPIVTPPLVPAQRQRMSKVPKKQRVLPIVPEPIDVTKNPKVS